MTNVIQSIKVIHVANPKFTIKTFKRLGHETPLKLYKRTQKFVEQKFPTAYQDGRVIIQFETGDDYATTN